MWPYLTPGIYNNSLVSRWQLGDVAFNGLFELKMTMRHHTHQVVFHTNLIISLSHTLFLFSLQAHNCILCVCWSGLKGIVWGCSDEKGAYVLLWAVCEPLWISWTTTHRFPFVFFQATLSCFHTLSLHLSLKLYICLFFCISGFVIFKKHIYCMSQDWFDILVN